MFLIYILAGYLIGSLPGISFFTDKLDSFNKKTVVIPKKGITISHYPAFNWQWIAILVDTAKLIIFYYLLGLNSFSWMLGLTLGHVFPVWNPIKNRSTMILVFIFYLKINIYFFILFTIIELLVVLFNSDFKEVPLIITTFFIAIFFWVSGANIFFVLLPILFLIFSLQRFVTFNQDKFTKLNI